MALPQTSKSVNLPQTLKRALDLQRQRKLPEAEKLYAQVLAVRPDYFDALHMLGLIKMEQGDPAGALRLMAAALKARPQSPEVLLNFSLVLNSLGRLEEALIALDSLIAINKRSLEAHNNKGAVLERLGRDEEAIESFDRVLAIKSSHIDALYNRASVLRKIGRLDEAIKGFNRVIALKPDHAKAHNNRGAALEASGRRADAIASYDRALAIDPNFVEALNNRANALLKDSRLEEAVTWYERASAIDPFHVELLTNLGTALSALGRYREALALTRRAAGVNPGFVNAQWNLALLELRLGDLAAGWQQYEWRWQRAENANRLVRCEQPLWLGETPIAGKTVYLHHEQGSGDTIQFARYAPLLVSQGARVILEVPPLLKTLIGCLRGPNLEVIASGEKVPEFDVHAPLMSMPLAFRTELASIPAQIPYLSVAERQIACWREQLPQGKGLRVGFVWSGNATHRDDHNRSIALAKLLPLLDLPGLQFISLQKDLRESDAEVLKHNPRLIDFGGQFDGFDDTAAAVAAMDLVISVDTSVAHLAGALGKPVWVLLPFCPDWRWLTEREDSPWYPTARLFRQPAIGDWESVIAKVGAALKQCAQSGAAQASLTIAG